MKASSFLSARWTGLLLLTAILLALLIAQYFVRGSDGATEAAPVSVGLVDQTPLITARHLATEARSAAEQQEAAQALRIADHEVDQSFEMALRNAVLQPEKLSGEALTVSQRITTLESKVDLEKQNIADLTRAEPKAAHPEDAAQQIELAQAALDLDEDVLNDLHQDLIRLGGDRHARIQQALDEHEMVQKQGVTMPSLSAPEDVESPTHLETLPGKFEAYIEIRHRDQELRLALSDANVKAERLTGQRDSLEKLTEVSGAQSAVFTGGAPVDALKSLRALSGQQKALAELDTRIHDEQQLAAVYKVWEQVAISRERSILHRMLVALAVIAGLLLAVFLITAGIRRHFAARIEDRRRLGHLRIVVELIVQVCALGIILIVVFGPPKQIPAIIGLATAGVTIVMKDFIVAFIGWFPLMGRNGVRVGDWVEINGVSGEVVEIGMLRTVLLETGNWAEAGHPTGRRVTFMNSFAIEGRYFNFSTTGQWLWDELRVTVSRGGDAYGRIEKIRQLVAGATQQDSAIAEEEWRKATRDEALKGFSADPAIDLRPAVDGIEVTVRYITRAQKRYEVRSKLYEEVIRVLHYEDGSDGLVQAPPLEGQDATPPVSAEVRGANARA